MGQSPDWRSVDATPGQQDERTVGTAPHDPQSGNAGPEGVGFTSESGAIDTQDLVTVYLSRPGDPVQPLDVDDTVYGQGVVGRSGVYSEIELG